MIENKMATKSEKLNIWDKDLDSVLVEVGEFSGSKQFMAYFFLLYRILFEALLSEKECRLAAEVVLEHLDAHVIRNRRVLDWGKCIPEPLMVLVMAAIVKLGMDIEPLMARGRADFDSGHALVHIDLKDNNAADIVLDLFNHKQKHLDMDLMSLCGLMISFSKSGNGPMADMMLDKFRELVSPLEDEAKKIDYWGWLLVELYEKAGESIGARILAEFLPALESAAFSISLKLLKLALFLKKTDAALAKRLHRLAKEEIMDIVDLKIGEKEFKREFGVIKEQFLREAALELSRAGDMKMALDAAKEIEKELSLKAEALSGIAVNLFRNGRKKQAEEIMAEALVVADKCGEKYGKDLALNSLSTDLMIMGKADAANAALDGIKLPLWKCFAMTQIGKEFFSSKAWKKGEDIFDRAIQLAGRSLAGEDFTSAMGDISLTLAHHGYDEWALTAIRSIRTFNPEIIKTAAKEVFGGSGGLKAVEFLEKAYDIPFFPQPDPAADSLDAVN